MTPEEVSAFKQTIMEQIAVAKIKIYEFPEVSDGEENDRKENRRMKERVPFAVVGSNMIIDVDGKKARGRRYFLFFIKVFYFHIFLGTLGAWSTSRTSTTATSCPC